MDQTNNNSEYISGANVPPPPAEVWVRTMASDLASIAERGGGSPKPRLIRISSRSQEATKAAAIPHAAHPAISPAVVHSAAASSAAAETQNPVPESKSLFSKPSFLLPFLGVLLIGVFSVAYFFVYPLLNPNKPVVKAPVVPATTQPLSFEHKSFFGQPVDGNFILEILSPVSGMESERDKISSFVNGVTSSFFEITPQSGGGRAISADDFFSSIGGNILGSDFLNENFEKDFTLFLYKDKGGLPAPVSAGRQAGLWPGYILKLKSGKSPIFLQNAVLKKMESASSERANLFLVSPGVPANSQFQNGLSSGQPIWFLNFPNASSVLAYGWFFNKYMTISTSLDGLKQAILHF
ncbi:MAG: hypothetical protein Q7K44_00600 [Candidatus Liptonbacteria bacterium]|nr:hypothetical protein [Candidatus Liptonbacteria bacterium]